MTTTDSITSEIKVEYSFPPFYRRVLANTIDAIFFLLSFVALFIGVRDIVTSTQQYQTNIAEMAMIKLNSCLYLPSDLVLISDIENFISEEEKILPADIKQITDIVSVLNDDNLFGSASKISGAQTSIRGFHAYCEAVCSLEDYQKIILDYEGFMLSDNLVNDNGVRYFVKDNENNIVINTQCVVSSEVIFYEEGYAPYIDQHALGFLITSVPRYYECSKYLSSVLLFVEIPIAYCLAGLLIYLLPVLIFRHGRMTFGKAIYRIGCLDAHFLSPKIGRTLARFTIFYVGELILSLVSFGIPFIISFSLMAFSKNKQGFPDYMLGIVEVDSYRTKIFLSKEEIAFKGISTYSKAVDFKVKEKN